jgi:hypothetical protein
MAILRHSRIAHNGDLHPLMNCRFGQHCCTSLQAGGAPCLRRSRADLKLVCGRAACLASLVRGGGWLGQGLV